ncbi:hypothetical protein F5Y11DRAFT_309444 [Daldinia sp. FL1419]|nr:hypothetical protein F5Y11DRAFT_309444 [Daldinia sp. FL1419]
MFAQACIADCNRSVTNAPTVFNFPKLLKLPPSSHRSFQIFSTTNPLTPSYKLPQRNTILDVRKGLNILFSPLLLYFTNSIFGCYFYSCCFLGLITSLPNLGSWSRSRIQLEYGVTMYIVALPHLLNSSIIFVRSSHSLESSRKLLRLC